MFSSMFLVYSLITSYVCALKYIFVIFTITALFCLPLIPTFTSFFLTEFNKGYLHQPE